MRDGTAGPVRCEAFMSDPSSKTLKRSEQARGRHLPALCVIILTNLIFAALYRRFITGSAVYMYADIGNDSLSSSYPLLMMLSRLFHEGRFPFYDLTFGLGTDITSLYLQYLNPIKLFMLLFPTEMMPWAILISTWIQVNFLAVFAYIFFRAALRDETAAVIPSLMWTFTGYVVLWGQNYSFLTCILLFTMTICLIRLYLAGRRPTVTLWLIPVIALFLISNYYFLYMTALFAVFYVIAWGISSGQGFGAFLKKVLGLAAMALSGAVMGCVAVLPIVRTFLGSNRVSRLMAETGSQTAGFSLITRGALTGAFKTASIFPAATLVKTHDGPTLLTFLGRFMSTNFFGPGSGYRGAVNYYEAACLAVSALCIYAIVYLLVRKGARLITALAVLLAVLLLLFPACSQVLSMSAAGQRWSFMIAFMECVAAGLFVKALLRDTRRSSDRALTLTLIAAPLVTLACLALLFAGRQLRWFGVSPKAVLVFGSFFMMYEILLFIYRLRRSTRFLLVTLIACLAGELFLANHMTVNDRIYMTKEAFYSSYYNNGAEQTAPAILAADPELYRISHTRQTDPALFGITATADKMFANEGMVNGYPGTGVYTSTLPSSLTSYGEAVLSEQGRNNFFIVDYDNYYLYTLLGGHYVFGEVSDQPLAHADRALYKAAGIDGTAEEQVVLKNENALPFGYLYTEKIDPQAFAVSHALDRMRALAGGYILTDDIMSTYEAGDLSGSEAVSNQGADEAGEAGEQGAGETGGLLLSSLISMTNDCEMDVEGETFKVMSTGADPFVVFHMPDTTHGRTLMLDLGCALEDGRPQSLQIFSATESYPNFGPDLCRDVTFSDPSTELVLLLSDHMSDLRIDIIPGETVTFNVASLSAADPSADFAALKASPVTDISYTYEGQSPVYKATVSVGGSSGDAAAHEALASDSAAGSDAGAGSGIAPASDDGAAMFCVPLPYSTNWHASVDGQEASIENINGGLIGVPLKKGTHEVTLTYRVPYFRLTALVSLLAVILFIIVLTATALRRRSR